MAGAGATVYVTDRNGEGGRRVTEAIVKDGRRAIFLPLDVTNETHCQTAAAAVLGEYPGGLDILVNNAGIGHVGTIVTTRGEDLDRLYQVNVRGIFNVSQAFIGPMVARRAGVIIHTASIAGIVAIHDRLAYATTKFAVVGMTKCMALDHAKDGIRVNCVCPGRVETPFVKARLREYADPEAAYREMAASQALGRMGTPEEIAAAVLYLASDEAAFVTGSALIIDGGLSAGE